MKIAALLVLLLPLLSVAQIVKYQDEDSNCISYRVVSEDKPALEYERIEDARSAYGMTLENMEVDFQKKLVKVNIVKRLVLNFDESLLRHKVTISAENPNFKFLVNQLNRQVFTFDQVCISDKQELVWATYKIVPGEPVD